MTKPTLWVIGDSFSQPRIEIDTPKLWTELVADQLGCNLVNDSYYGVSQDFCWMHLQLWSIQQKIQPEDYVIVVLTHPNRYWYLDEHPDLSNGHQLIDLDEHVGRAQAQAIKGYIQYIQRPSLDSIQQISRMGWLAWNTFSQNLRRPLVIKAFEFELHKTDKYSSLNVANGQLFDIQLNEYCVADRERVTEYFYGADPRWNHMCLDNHKILADRVCDSFVNDSQLDLTQGFLTELLPLESIDNDLEFCQRELNPQLYEHYLKTKDRMMRRGLNSWLAPIKRNAKT